MQSAGLRTRGRASIAPSVDETASIVTLHTIPDGAATPASKSKRTTFANPSRSQVPSSNTSLIIQKHEASRPPTSGSHSRSSGKARAPKNAPRDQPPPVPKPGANEDSEDSSLDDLEEPDVTPPKFTIDLSKPPAERYNHVAQHFTPHRVVLEKLFRTIARESYNLDADKARKWGKRMFRKVPSAEEMEEIKGIANVWGVEVFLLVAFNVLLDSFMGCTSGGVRVRDPISRTTSGTGEDISAADTTDSRGRMLHLRTLDWGMEPLRKLVCEYEYVSQPGAAVVARQVTYFGFVGVLTGLRKGLSISLNFRPSHDTSNWWKALCFRTHQLFVLLGWRQSICSILRECLLPSKYQPLRTLPTLVDVERDMPSKKTTAAYLIFSDGSRTTTMEKDHATAVVRSASDFIVALNHDVADESRTAQGSGLPENIDNDANRDRQAHDIFAPTGMTGLVELSEYRKGCIVDHWKKTRAKRKGPSVRTEDVIEWMRDPEICNDETHYGVVMDPTYGEFVWLRRWLRPLEPHDLR